MGSSSQQWLSKQDKLKEVVKKLKEFAKKGKKEKNLDESGDIVTYNDDSGAEKILDIVPTGQGQKAAATAKRKGLTTAQVRKGK
jgi:hypothetical protein